MYKEYKYVVVRNGIYDIKEVAVEERATGTSYVVFYQSWIDKRSGKTRKVVFNDTNLHLNCFVLLDHAWMRVEEVVYKKATRQHKVFHNLWKCKVYYCGKRSNGHPKPEVFKTSLFAMFVLSMTVDERKYMQDLLVKVSEGQDLGQTFDAWKFFQERQAYEEPDMS